MSKIPVREEGTQKILVSIDMTELFLARKILVDKMCNMTSNHPSYDRIYRNVTEHLEKIDKLVISILNGEEHIEIKGDMS